MSDEPTVPDLRQTLSYTMLAAAFILLGILNPYAGPDAKPHSHTWMAVVLIVAITASWAFTVRRWKKWRGLPEDVRATQIKTLRKDTKRAKSHALMCALALMLTAFAFLGRAAMPDIKSGFTNNFLFFTASLIALFASVVLAKTIRDMAKFRRNSE